MPVTKPPFVMDADTLLAYRCNETASQTWTQFRDEGPLAAHMTLASNPYAELRNWNGVLGRFGRRFNNTVTPPGTLANSAALTSFWLNTYTIEAFVLAEALNSNDLFHYANTGETEATNYLGRMAFQANGRLDCFWEYDLGVNGGGSQGVGDGLVVGVVTHVAIRKRRVGHIMDANVVAMWGLDEGQGTACQDLSPNVRNITWVNTPTIANGQIYKCRTFNGTTQYGTSPAVSAFRTAVDESLTVEAWINITTWADSTIICYAGATAVLANRNLFELAIDSTGHLVARWENDTSGMQTFTSPGTIATGGWHHVAMKRTTTGASSVVDLFIDGVKVGTSGSLVSPTIGSGTTSLLSVARHPAANRYFAGSIDEVRISNVARSDAEIIAGYTEGITNGSTAGNSYIDYFVNGVLQETDGPLPGPTGGTSDILEFGESFQGMIRSLRLSKVARADVEIAADAAIADHMHVTDASTAYHWRLDELPDLVDDGPYGVHLRHSGTPQTKTQAIVNDAGGASGARLFASSSWDLLDYPRSDVAALALGEITVRIAAYFPSLNASGRSLCSWGETGFESDSTRNYLWFLHFSAASVLSFGWEYLAGSGVQVDAQLNRHGGLHIIHGIRRNDPANPGKFIGEIWIDGERLVTANNLTGPSGGNNAIHFFGKWSSTSNANTLVLDDYHVQKRALTELEIRTDAGLPVLPSLDTAAPTMAAHSPAGGATLALSSSTIAVNVTDAALSGLARVILVAHFDDGLPPEVVYTGSAFGTGYTGSVLAITGGNRYTFARDAGWRENPTIKLYARDGVTNEGLFVSSLSYVFDVPPANLPPTIENVLPAPGGALDVDEAITFDLVDDYGFTRVFLYAKFPTSGTWEVIHDGTAFGPKYSAGSSRTPDGNGYSYSVQRTGGWPESPTLEVLPVDSSGLEPV